MLGTVQYILFSMKSFLKTKKRPTGSFFFTPPSPSGGRFPFYITKKDTFRCPFIWCAARDSNKLLLCKILLICSNTRKSLRLKTTHRVVFLTSSSHSGVRVFFDINKKPEQQMLFRFLWCAARDSNPWPTDS